MIPTHSPASGFFDLKPVHSFLPSQSRAQAAPFELSRSASAASLFLDEKCEIGRDDSQICEQSHQIREEVSVRPISLATLPVFEFPASMTEPLCSLERLDL